MAIRGVGFDYLGVAAQLSGRSIFDVIGELTGMDSDRVRTAHRKHDQDFQRGVISHNELWRAVADELGHPEQYEAILVAANQDRPVPDQFILTLVDQLRAGGYKVGLLTNLAIGTAWDEDLYRLGVDTHFDSTLLSGKTGFAKPDLRAYKLLANELGVATDELVFIDDRPESMEGIEKLGIKPILFTSIEDLKLALANLGVII